MDFPNGLLSYLESVQAAVESGQFDYMNMQSVAFLVQEFIELSAKSKEKFLTKMLEVCFESASSEMIENMFCDKQASRVWEKVVIHCSEDETERLYQLFLQGKLPVLAKHSIGNFPLQKLISGARSEEMLTDIMDELDENVLEEVVFGKNHSGILVALIEAVSRVSEKTDELLKVMMKLFNCRKPKSRRPWLLSCCLALKKFDSMNVSETETTAINFDTSHIPLQGSLVAQKMLDLKPNDSIIVQCKLISPEILQKLSCSVTGSHFVDKIFNSESVSQQDKGEIFQSHFEGSWATLASDKYGSRVLDTVWKNISMKEKCIIADELSQSFSKLTQSKGSFLRICFMVYSALHIFQQF